MNSTWTVEFDAAAHRDLRALDPTIQRRLVQFLRTRVAGLDSPRALGKPLKGEKTGLWRYRVGTYRIICLLENDRHVVVVVAIGHRREVYR
ncbi:type II toxin-antitoxin system RelE/ParE family toxin [Sulfobacillus sp. hq2]|uniref:type II toxin-antitoxin system RelE family toxin n=1 Tax=Sulfobacillus TaxID=28033 RepID=UPI000CD0EE4E|nr:type II toxin-antitoxin system RelE/ParE family toxin [Sulfobacillus sp. hq2]POB11770.1 type II toxin-antitoxin system mRNA interferase toxin, RelE/StbE family [Sulfobacillus sp. hq2]